MKPFMITGLRMTMTFRNILLDDSDQKWFNKTWDCLDRIWDLAAGRKMLDLIHLKHQHNVEIVPSSTGKNTCKTGGKLEYQRFVTLRQAFYQNGGKTIKDELGNALAKAGMAMVKEGAPNWALDHLASQLARGLSPVTIHTDKNVKPTSALPFDVEHRFLSQTEKAAFDTRSKKQLKKGDTVASLDERTQRARALLDDLLSGAKKYIDMDVPRLLPEEYKGAKTEKSHTISDDLVRLLKPWLTPGDGCSCTVKFAPDAEYSCDLDREDTKRPPAIGLAHELCHAWRNVTGMRLFEDATRAGVDDDEVMTTGFPPYHNEEISENMFRSQWEGEQLRMRTDYDTYKVEEETKKMILAQRATK